MVVVKTACAISFPASGTNSIDQDFYNLYMQESFYPSCGVKDYYWYQKSGEDKLMLSPAESDAIILEADSIVGQNSGGHVANGNVQVYKGDRTFNADWVTFDQTNNHISGGSNIVLTQQYNVIEGKWVDYYMDLNRGTIKQAVLYNNESGIYASGDTIRILNQKQVQIENAYMTTCNPKNPDWHITSDLTTFDYQDSQGSARKAKFYIESTNIVTFPYFQFPLGERRSGFLSPQLGYLSSQFADGSPNNAVYMGTPYYWNMAPNYDMTIEPRFYSTDGFMLIDQFRFKNNTGSGELYTEQMPIDLQINQYRYYNHFVDNHTIFKDMDIGFNYNQVSDSNYFVNFGNFYSTVDNINLDQSVYAKYTPSWGLLGAKFQKYQVLQPVNQPAVYPIYATSPQINFNVKPQPLYNGSNEVINAELHSQYSNFEAQGLQTGERIVVYPSLTYPIQNQWGFVKPKFGWNYTNYQLDQFAGIQSNSSSVDRNIPITSLDSGLIFERLVSLGNKTYSQTFEPRVYYLYVPSVNQQNLPVFDTAPATYNINQLFTENRFVGDDRINMANDITIGINSKLINDNTGTEFSNWGLGYRHFITPENNFIYGNTTQQPQLFLPQPNLIAELGNRWSSIFNTNLSYQYSTFYQNIDAYSLQAKYSPEPYKIVNARFSYQYQMPLLYYSYVPGQIFNPVNYEDQYALDLSGQWPIYGNRWLVNGRVNYDFTYGSFLNLLSGIEYNGGCWGIKATYERYVTNVNQLTNAYFLVFELKGLTSLGSDPTTELRNNIPGYMPNQLGYVPVSNIR